MGRRRICIDRDLKAHRYLTWELRDTPRGRPGRTAVYRKLIRMIRNRMRRRAIREGLDEVY